MEQKRKLVMPLKLVLLDVVGTAMVGLGVAKHFANVDLIPAALRFENYGITFVVAGVALMAPLILHLIGAARQKGHAREP